LIGEDAKIIHVDTNPANIGRFRRVDLGIVGDTRETATAISRELTEQQLDRDGELWTDSIRNHIAETSPLDDREFPAQDGRIDPRDVVRTLDRVVPEDRLVVTDGGHFVRWVLDGIEVKDPLDYIWTLDFGSIGQGLPIGIGAAEATDRRTCVTVCGDAGFMMVLQEVETAARNEIPLLIVVLNDDALGVEYHSLNNTGEYPDVALSETPDLAGVADKLGATGHTIRSPSDIEELSEELGTRPDGPIVLDCKVNRNVIHRSKL
jgi:thiamine pyrophosphate-dependent acetolactate synthase large subunit-like protein